MIGQCNKCHLVAEVAEVTELESKIQGEIDYKGADKYNVLCQGCFDQFIINEIEYLDKLDGLIEYSNDQKGGWTKKYKEGYIAGLISARELYVLVEGDNN